MSKPIVPRLFWAIAIAAILAVGPSVGDANAGGVAARGDPAACAALDMFAGAERDAGPTLRACLAATPVAGRIALKPGRYLIASPFAIRRAVTLTTRAASTGAHRCSRDERQCAVLHLAIPLPAPPGTVMPVEVAGNGIRLDRLVFEGTRRTDPGLSARRCAVEAERPAGGGLRISGDDIAIRRSVFRDFACYTALEYGTGADVTVADNDFTGNGTHDASLRWADGLTIHTGLRFNVTGNRFRDNTDVQLIFGGCVDCVVARNTFSHGGSAAGGSFAELMLQAWPKATSGDFTGTHVFDNDIDCGAMRRCGFGIMIGSTPWYDAPAFGGSVVGNRVRRAILALDVDRLTGPMTIDRNRLMPTTGVYPGNCGPQRIAGIAANVSPDSRRFVRSEGWSHPTTYRSYCILNYAVKNAAPVSPTS